VLREPLVHFFFVGALLFFARRWVASDPRTITVTPGLQAELKRRFRDLNGRPPDSAEFAAALKQWEHDEALFREALRDHLDRDDSAVRSALVDKMHARAAFEVPKREPTDTELQSWLGAHQSQYQTPLRYDFEFLAFPKSEPAAQIELAKCESQVLAGANASSLGRPLIGATLSVADMKGRIEPELAARIPGLPLGQWQRVDTSQNLLLARVKQVEGGLPSLEELRPRLVADWSFAVREEGVERILQRTIERYHVEERP
jgi:hypothetical protein